MFNNKLPHSVYTLSSTTCINITQVSLYSIHVRRNKQTHTESRPRLLTHTNQITWLHYVHNLLRHVYMINRLSRSWCLVTYTLQDTSSHSVARLHTLTLSETLLHTTRSSHFFTETCPSALKHFLTVCIYFALLRHSFSLWITFLLTEKLRGIDIYTLRHFITFWDTSSHSKTLSHNLRRSLMLKNPNTETRCHPPRHSLTLRHILIQQYSSVHTETQPHT